MTQATVWNRILFVIISTIAVTLGLVIRGTEDNDTLSKYLGGPILFSILLYVEFLVLTRLSTELKVVGTGLIFVIVLVLVDGLVATPEERLIATTNTLIGFGITVHRKIEQNLFLKIGLLVVEAIAIAISLIQAYVIALGGPVDGVLESPAGLLFVGVLFYVTLFSLVSNAAKKA